MMQFCRKALGYAAILYFVAGSSISQAGDKFTVFAAASLKNALDDIVKAHEARTGDKVVVAYAASPALARQIASGAPADLH